MKQKRIHCPNCGQSDKIYTKCVGEEIGKVLGFGLGTALLIGGVATLPTALLTSFVPKLLASGSGKLGVVGNCLSGGFAMMEVGREIGKQWDLHYESQAKCFHCHVVFKI